MPRARSQSTAGPAAPGLPPSAARSCGPGWPLHTPTPTNSRQKEQHQNLTPSWKLEMLLLKCNGKAANKQNPRETYKN